MRGEHPDDRLPLRRARPAREASGDPGDDLIGGFITAEVGRPYVSPARTSSTSRSCSCSPASTPWPRRCRASSTGSPAIPSNASASCDDPDVLPAAIEELMRFQTPVVAGGRLRDGRLRDRRASRCGRATTSTSTGPSPTSTTPGSTCPLDVDFDREAKRHIAFASGFHRCLGSHLARLELKVMLDRAARADPRLRPRSGTGARVQQHHDPQCRPAPAGVHPRRPRVTVRLPGGIRNASRARCARSWRGSRGARAPREARTMVRSARRRFGSGRRRAAPRDARARALRRRARTG